MMNSELHQRYCSGNASRVIGWLQTREETVEQIFKLHPGREPFSASAGPLSQLKKAFDSVACVTMVCDAKIKGQRRSCPSH